MINEAGFVAGTPVHTREGVVPIEQIKVGDWVLSKPESGEGGADYKRVTRTFKHDDREVYLVRYSVLDEHNQRVYEHVAATGEHPFWVRQLVDQVYNDQVKDYSGWLNAGKINKLCDDTQMDPVFELQDGHLARYEHSAPIVQSETPGIGFLCNYPIDPSGPWGRAVDFSSGYPGLPVDARGRFMFAYLGCDYELIELDPDSDSIYGKTGCQPLLRKVYNLEVEDYHTYFVGEMGIRVRDKSAGVITP